MGRPCKGSPATGCDNGRAPGSLPPKTQAHPGHSPAPGHTGVDSKTGIVQKSPGSCQQKAVPNHPGQPTLVLTLCFAPLPFQGWGVRPLPTWTALPPHLVRSNREKMDFEAKLMSAFQKPLLQMEFIHPFFPSCHQCSWASILTDARPTGPDRNEGAWFPGWFRTGLGLWHI